jgi:hypothetical protein
VRLYERVHPERARLREKLGEKRVVEIAHYQQRRARARRADLSEAFLRRDDRFT